MAPGDLALGVVQVQQVAVGHGTDRGERRVSSRYVDVDAAIARVVAESGYPERQGWAEYYLKPPPAP